MHKACGQDRSCTATHEHLLHAKRRRRLPTCMHQRAVSAACNGCSAALVPAAPAMNAAGGGGKGKRVPVSKEIRQHCRALHQLHLLCLLVCVAECDRAADDEELQALHCVSISSGAGWGKASSTSACLMPSQHLHLMLGALYRMQAQVLSLLPDKRLLLDTSHEAGRMMHTLSVLLAHFRETFSLSSPDSSTDNPPPVCARAKAALQARAGPPELLVLLFVALVRAQVRRSGRRHQGFDPHGDPLGAAA
eukprot:352598-Chlamydomonas_euryale.AAC.30